MLDSPHASVIQGSPEWRAARVGCVTASRVADVVATVKSGGYGAQRANYMAELILERLTGTPAQKFTNAAMKRGTELEPDARAAYSFMTDAEVTEVGFIDHPQIGMAGCSPDGVLGDDGLVEIKCMGAPNHLDILLTGKIPDEYIKQIQFQIACCERGWCDFVAYSPDFPPAMRLYIKRVERDDKLIAKLEDEARRFLDELDANVASVIQQYGVR